MISIKIRGFDLHPETKAFLGCEGTTPYIVLVRRDKQLRVVYEDYGDDSKLTDLFPNLADDELVSVAANTLNDATLSIMEEQNKPSSEWTVSIYLFWREQKHVMLSFPAKKGDFDQFLMDGMTNAAIEGFLPEYPMLPLQVRFWLCHFDFIAQRGDQDSTYWGFACAGVQDPTIIDQYNHDWLQVPANSALYNRLVRDIVIRHNRMRDLQRCVRMDLTNGNMGKEGKKKLVLTPEYARTVLESGFLASADNAWCQIAS